LQVTGHPSYGLPWGQDRLIPIFLATLAIRRRAARINFNSVAEMLDTFGMQQGRITVPPVSELFSAYIRRNGARNMPGPESSGKSWQAGSD